MRARGGIVESASDGTIESAVASHGHWMGDGVAERIAASTAAGVPLVQRAPGLASYAGTAWVGSPPAHVLTFDPGPASEQLEAARRWFERELRAVDVPKTCWRSTPTDDASVEHFIHVAHGTPTAIRYPHSPDQTRQLSEWRKRIRRTETSEVRGDIALTGLWIVDRLTAHDASAAHVALLARILDRTLSASREGAAQAARSASGGRGRKGKLLPHVKLIHEACDTLERVGRAATPAKVRKVLREKSVELDKHGDPYERKVWRYLAEQAGVLVDIDDVNVSGSVLEFDHPPPRRRRTIDDDALAAILRRRKNT